MSSLTIAILIGSLYLACIDHGGYMWVGHVILLCMFVCSNWFHSIETLNIYEINDKAHTRHWDGTNILQIKIKKES